MTARNLNVRRRMDGKIEVSSKMYVTWSGLYTNTLGDGPDELPGSYREVRTLEWVPVFVSADREAVAAFVSANDFAPRSAGDGFGAGSFKIPRTTDFNL